MSHESFSGEVLTKRETELNQEEKRFIDECSNELVEIRGMENDIDIFSATETYSSAEEADCYEEMSHFGYAEAFADLERKELELAERILTFPKDKRLFILKKAKEAYLTAVQNEQPVRESTEFEKIDKSNAALLEAKAKEIFNRIFRLAISLENEHK